jgi:hypothetical protein
MMLMMRMVQHLPLCMMLMMRAGSSMLEEEHLIHMTNEVEHLILVDDMYDDAWC